MIWYSKLLLLFEFIQNNNTLFLGDFNFNEYSNYLRTLAPTCRITSLINFSNFLNFEQYNHIKNRNENILDLVLSNMNCIVDKAPDILINEDSHHPALLILFNINKKYNNNKSTVNFSYYNYRKANLVELYQNLANIDWHSLFDIQDINYAFEQFYEKIYAVLDSIVPRTIIKGKSYPPWYNANIIKSIKLKHRAWCDYKNFEDPLALDEFKLLRTYIKEQVDVEYRKYCRDIENNIKINPTKFWQFIGNKRSSKNLPTAMHYKDKQYVGNTELVNGFAEYFRSSYTPSNGSIEDNLVDADNEFFKIESFTEQQVLSS